jgi:hypothetical protein
MKYPVLSNFDKARLTRYPNSKELHKEKQPEMVKVYDFLSDAGMIFMENGII